MYVLEATVVGETVIGVTDVDVSVDVDVAPGWVWPIWIVLVGK